MNWLHSSQLRPSMSRSSREDTNSSTFNEQSNPALGQRSNDATANCDPKACYDSFCKHWQQAYDIIQQLETTHKNPTHDDVLGVISHFDYMVTLLLVELHHYNTVKPAAAQGSEDLSPSPCLEFMLHENLLDKLCAWGSLTGRYSDAVRLEQLKLYELLISHWRHQLLSHRPFLRPLLKMLASCQGKTFPVDLEKRLVTLLNQLCVVLMQNVHLLDVFFLSDAQDKNQQQSEHNKDQSCNVTSSTNFIIFSLLIPYVHREGSLGHQARDALLLCMALSQKSSNVSTYIAQYSSMCPLLVTALGGLYSRLPNSIEIISNDWHRITPDDVAEMPELTLFMNALEFCNAVAQVAHESIKSQLLDFMYQGFIVPVLGHAILQTNIGSQISAMSYLDLILRSVTEPALLRAFIRFLLDAGKFDGEPLIDTLIERLRSPDASLCVVTLALFDTLLGLHCEDLMLELLLKYLLLGKHIPLTHRHKINKVDAYIEATKFFFELTPNVMKGLRDTTDSTKHKQVEAINNNQSTNVPSPTSLMSKTIGANWNYYGIHTGHSLYSNYQAYLFEARHKIEQCQKACLKWNHSYSYQKPSCKQQQPIPAHTMELIKEFFTENSNSSSSTPNAGISTSKWLDTSIYESSGEPNNDKEKFDDSLPSIGESSGYESLRWRSPEEADDGRCALPSSNESESNKKSDDWWRLSINHSDFGLADLDFSDDLFAQGTVSLGPFLNAIWDKLQTFTSNSLYVNLHLTGLITHLTWYPLPLIHSVLLRPDIVITSETPAFHQILRILKQQIDAELPVTEDSLEIIDVARSHLIDREFNFIRARKNESIVHARRTTVQQQQQQRRCSSGGAPNKYNNKTIPSTVQSSTTSPNDSFKRNDSKRRSIGKSITSMFSRKSNASSGLSQIYSFFTGPNFHNNGNSGSNSLAADTEGGQSTHSTARANSLTRETSLCAIPDRNNCSYSEKASSSSSSAAVETSLVTVTSARSNLFDVNGINLEPMVSMDSISSMGVIAHTSGTERTRDLALCAVLLDEWLKELAAVAQEQYLILVNDNI